MRSSGDHVCPVPRPADEWTQQPRDVAAALLALPAQDIARAVARRPLEDGAQILHAILARERLLAAENRLPAYADKLAPVVEALDPGIRSGLVARLAPTDAVEALRGSFRPVDPQVRHEVFATVAPLARGAILDAMAHGWDGPREAAAVLAAVRPQVAADGLAAAAPEVRRALLALVAPALAASITSYDPALLIGLAPGHRSEIARAARLLAGAAPDPDDDADDRRPAPVMAAELASMDPADAAVQLRAVGARRRIAVLGLLPAEAAAALLTALAGDAAAEAAEALVGLADVVLDPDGAERLHRARAAAILPHLDPDAESVARLLARVPRGRLTALLRRCGGTPAAASLAALAGLPPVGFAAVAHPPLRASGRRRSRRIAGLEAAGGRHVSIEEHFETVDGRHRLRVDLLELDASAVRLEARRATGGGRRLPVADAIAGLGDSRAVAPSAGAFADLGLVRLADAVHEAGALGGINGGFYVDFGQIIDARDLGMDLGDAPGLHFGDPIGWYVEDGEQVTPAVFARAALVVTDDGRTHVRRVGMRDVRLCGRTLTWASANRPRDGRTALFTSICGLRTPPDADYVDVSVVDGAVHELVLGGGARIPLTGFVLSVPRREAGASLEGVRAGTPVEAVSDFPRELGRPRSAMACGPLLVRDGQVDLDLAAEELGDKDTATLPFSLARSVDRFRAARSFVGLCAGRLVLGAVSGVTLGSGSPRVSAGVTFGELAQLCADLGMDEAMGLDGGGSTSVVAAVGTGPDRRAEVLSVPTGGADVPEGHERFINTYWLAFAR